MAKAHLTQALAKVNFTAGMRTSQWRTCGSKETAAPRSLRGKVVGLALIVFSAPAAGESVIHHNIHISLIPATGALKARDTVTLPEEIIGHRRELSFFLHAGLNPIAKDTGVTTVRDGMVNVGVVPLEQFRLRLPPGTNRVTLHYSGTIQHALATFEKGYRRADRTTPGLISSDGVYLTGQTHWYPHFGDALLRFSMEVDLPAGWLAISQGAQGITQVRDGRAKTSWREDRLQEEIYLVAGHYHVYSRTTDKHTALILLRSPDELLAAKYLDATWRYIDLYSRLIGPYPYEKFALIENFWETGYGMPSFTLLGPRVIRLPFILHSSYPHEILHNWWGNGVYVARQGGNWTEGLTAYLADHLIQEQRGKGAAYRRDVLQKYTDYVRKAQDFPLTEFRARHGDTSQAVGYGKALMFFHMLRLRLGDATFVKGLRRFYEANRFRRASYDEIKNAFEAVAKLDLNHEFTQWLKHAGAPRLQMRTLQVQPEAQGYRLVGVLEQVQPGPTYVLRVPVVIHLETGNAPFETIIVMRKRQRELNLKLPTRPWLVEVDPAFDVFRQLERTELPPSLGQLFGSERALILLPADAPKNIRLLYRKLAQRWSHGSGAIQWRWDNALETLPTDRSIWLFGWTNRFRAQFAAALLRQDLAFTHSSVRIGKRAVARQREAVVVVARHPGNGAHALAWVACENPEAFAGLARKLPHYGKYSYLVFEGNAPRNVLKGQWAVLNSPLRILIDRRANSSLDSFPHRLPRPPLTAVLR